MGKTLIEKVLARASGRDEVKRQEIVFVQPHIILSHDNSAAIIKIFRKMGAKRVWDHKRVFIALDHAVPPPDWKKAQNHKEIRAFVEEQGIENFYDCGTGICHQVLPEHGHVVPGVVVFGSDSHTTTHGAFGAAGIPIGRTETASVWALGETWLKVPETIKIVLKGKLRSNVFPKDVILHVIGRLTADGASYKAVEFHGETIEEMSISGRMTLCNMASEMGAKAGMVPFDEKTKAWLEETGVREFAPLFPDEDAEYEKIVEFDCSELTPQVARPHKVDNVVPVSDVGDVKIDVALLGTCTNGRVDDLDVASRILDGKRVADGVRLLVYPASKKVLEEALSRGIIDKLVRAGAEVAVPACGPCLGAYGGVLAPGEVAISTANRNFKGRMGCTEDTGIYLASPATVAASAVAGRIVEPEL